MANVVQLTAAELQVIITNAVNAALQAQAAIAAAQAPPPAAAPPAAVTKFKAFAKVPDDFDGSMDNYMNFRRECNIYITDHNGEFRDSDAKVRFMLSIMKKGVAAQFAQNEVTAAMQPHPTIPGQPTGLPPIQEFINRLDAAFANPNLQRD